MLFLNCSSCRENSSTGVMASGVCDDGGGGGAGVWLCAEVGSADHSKTAATANSANGFQC
jgi:hypothetical protein